MNASDLVPTDPKGSPKDPNNAASSESAIAPGPTSSTMDMNSLDGVDAQPSSTSSKAANEDLSQALANITTYVSDHSERGDAGAGTASGDEDGEVQPSPRIHLPPLFSALNPHHSPAPSEGEILETTDFTTDAPTQADKVHAGNIEGRTSLEDMDVSDDNEVDMLLQQGPQPRSNFTTPASPTSPLPHVSIQFHSMKYCTDPIPYLG